MAQAKKTAKYFESLSKPGFYSDGGGLYLSIVGGSRTWMFRYKRGAKGHWMGLGPDSLICLAKARDAAIDARRLLRDGIDPIERKRAVARVKMAEAQPAKTFDSVAALYIKSHQAAWKNAKHGSQWTATLTAYAYPVFGDKSVDSITVDHVLEVLTPIWEAKPETASRLRGRIENVIDYAKSRGWRTGENPARWKGHLDHLLPSRASLARVVHHPAVPWRDVPKIMEKLAQAKGTGALCLRFTILTAARSGEARAATWNEFDLTNNAWTIPPEKMKAKLGHRVPLCDAATGILRTLLPLKTADDALVFPGGGKKKSPLSDVAVSKALAAIIKGYTVHGMRSTFRDWAAENTAFPREVPEAALAHTNRDKVEAAYRRSDLFEQRIRLMDDWSDYCSGTAPSATSKA